MSTGLLLVLLALFGLAIGSFLNVVIVRVPSNESLLRPPSKCPLCEHEIQPRDNIPIVSWLLLKGKCRHCSEPIPAGYPLVEAANMVLWILAGIRFGVSAEVVPYALLFSVLLALSVIDLELYILPNKITYPSILVSLVAIPLLSVVATDDPAAAMLGAAIGAIGFAGFLLVLLLAWELLLRKEGMGMGDVKLAILLGLWIGYINPLLCLFALIASSVIGLIVGIGILVVRRESRPFPFGPWLALGSILVILFSSPILGIYDIDTEDAQVLRSPASTSFPLVAGQ
ncbi:prepilin peptidase [Aquihabitans daechungensis]|uniref:prepilin peptidase n=1 Tax=Aquihabitans daechungensis TaxID=1052257 RepID=UPI003B9EC175